MTTNPITSYLLSDNTSLNDYAHGKPPTFEDIKRRLFLLLRNENKHIPDHYYRLNQSYFLKEKDSLATLLTKGLYELAENHLELVNERIYVKQSKLHSWQDLITRIPPLILQMAFLNVKKPLCTYKDSSELHEYCIKSILPNVRYTALPYPYIPEMVHLSKSQNGFHDLHTHLNGSTETDIVWQDLMLYPQKTIRYYKDSISNNVLAKEQSEQNFAPISTIELEQLLLVARRIRQYLFMVLFSDKDCNLGSSTKLELFEANNISELISNLINDKGVFYDGIKNPFTTFSINEGWNETPLHIEGLMYVLVLGYLSEMPKQSVATAFHLYLLILGYFNRLLVQQKFDYGFEEFQKHTLNGIRENCEKFDFKTRFLQLCGNNGNNIRFLEGRFSPKHSKEENELLIHKIMQDWEECWQDIRCMSDIKERGKPELKLIAHFIKKRENNISSIRHEELRKDVWNKANVLALMKENKSPCATNIIGIDAAASEFDAPPEVFAPAFRYLKRKGFRHFTYHAGEDFFHLLGGLRSIYEAVTFLGLSYGDRIGHATATGISPKQWIENVGEVIYMHKGEYLDDLIFAYSLITKHRNTKLKHTTSCLVTKIHELYYSIYKHSYSTEIICKAWELRGLCPFHVFTQSKDCAYHTTLFNNEEWLEVVNRLNIDTEENYGIKQTHIKNEIITILELYHDPFLREKYNEIIEVNATEFFSELELKELQLMILRFLNEKQIIIETLPTSNVRIGHHHTFNTYHLWNWIKWENEGNPIPPIVVGTDDPGIFGTNIYNEYSNIYCNLVYTHNLSRNQAMNIIEKLNNNALIYKFTDSESY